MSRQLVVSQILLVAEQVGKIVGGLDIEPDLDGAGDLDRQSGPDVKDGPAGCVGPNAESGGHAATLPRPVPTTCIEHQAGRPTQRLSFQIKVF